MKRKIIVGNWKMNPVTFEEAQHIYKKAKAAATKLTSTQVVMCPPFVYIPKFVPSKTGAKVKPVVSIGAQNVSTEPMGAHTGEVSAPMLKDLGATHVIVGHSERRTAGETDEAVSKKAFAVLEAGMRPIVCVGEAVHDSQGMYLETLKNQIKNSLSKVPKKLFKEIIVAYEPVWAIGAKEPMEAPMIEEMAIFIKKVLSDLADQDSARSIPILYGGSINFRNAPDIMTRGKVDGLLVGRESVNAPGFVELLKAVDVL